MFGMSIKGTWVPYAICKDCNVTVNVSGLDAPPKCARCGAATSWLVPPSDPAAALDDAPTLVRDPRSTPQKLDSQNTANLGRHPDAPSLSKPLPDDGPISRPTMPLNSSDDVLAESSVDRHTGNGLGILPRQTPNRMSIPSLSPPKQERDLPATTPTNTPESSGPTPRMVMILVFVAALTGIVLALLSP